MLRLIFHLHQDGENPVEGNPRLCNIYRTLENLRGVAECVAASTSSLSIEDDNVIQHTSSDTAAELDAVRQTFKVSYEVRIYYVV